MSQRSLTGYDNRDAQSNQPDEEVYEFDRQTGHLICASCKPTGARPEGIEYLNIENRRAGGSQVWPSTTWIAANIPGWTPFQLDQSRYQSRYLTNSGRLFFNSQDSLVPQDANGNEDVYEYEPEAVGSCQRSSSEFSSSSGGCISMLSGGASSEESAFLDASAMGPGGEEAEDVFFLTSSALTPKDVDQIGDVYDARVGGGESQGAQPVQCEGDGCQQPAVPPNDSTPGSLSFNGAGNVVQCPKGRKLQRSKCVKQKHKKHHKKKGHKKQRSSKRANAKHGGHK
jgi:hypothetical protein